MNQPFGPGATQDMILGATSASISISPDTPVVRLLFVANSVNAVAYLMWGEGTATATFNDFPLIANTPEYLSKPPGKDRLAGVANASGVGGILYVTAGW